MPKTIISVDINKGPKDQPTPIRSFWSNRISLSRAAHRGPSRLWTKGALSYPAQSMT